MNRRMFCWSSAAAAISVGSAAWARMPDAEPVYPTAALPQALTLPPGKLPLYKIVYDRRFPISRAFGISARGLGAATGAEAIDGDVTALWSNDLRLLWSAGGSAHSRGRAVAGMITVHGLLCLEQLAMDHRKRVLLRVEHGAVLAPAPAPAFAPKFSHRVTAPESMLNSLKVALAAADWPARLPALLASSPIDFGRPRHTRLFPVSDGLIAMPAQSLVSFVIV